MAIENYYYTFIAIRSGIKITIQPGRFLLYKRVRYNYTTIPHIYHVIRSLSKDYGCTKTLRRTEIDRFILIAVRTTAEGPPSVA